MEKDQIFILKDRGIVYISGEDAKNFLQNIITNDINKVTYTHSCFSSLLTPQGKYLFDFIVIKHKQGYFLDCELNQVESLISKLGIYKLKSKVEILNLSNEFQVAVISIEKFLTLDNSKNEEGHTIIYRDDPFFVDPRNKSLGARVIINLEKLYMSIKKLGLKLADSNKYYEISHKLGVAQVNTKNLQENLFGLECNFEKLNGIDFKKGCYIGQENTARMKLKNKLRRILLPVSFKGKISHLSEIKYKEKVVGKILITEPYPFALFKTVDPEIKELILGELYSNKTKLNIINDRYT
jgi:folate-binding protein YgfZ|tara:strand:- start:509 stop:1396 length:888 start_codon:yes stop_codon:yes gene_type:complete